mmetsp:Transcript_129325/g.374501  ORF Transcript_129325/g.374501 Transcript_129325/m.374501 type:complete len:273 (-) Transcript_129325:492-1310(-)
MGRPHTTSGARQLQAPAGDQFPEEPVILCFNCCARALRISAFAVSCAEGPGGGGGAAPSSAANRREPALSPASSPEATATAWVSPCSPRCAASSASRSRFFFSLRRSRWRRKCSARSRRSFSEGPCRSSACSRDACTACWARCRCCAACSASCSSGAWGDEIRKSGCTSSASMPAWAARASSVNSSLWVRVSRISLRASMSCSRFCNCIDSAMASCSSASTHFRCSSMRSASSAAASASMRCCSVVAAVSAWAAWGAEGAATAKPNISSACW